MVISFVYLAPYFQEVVLFSGILCDLEDLPQLNVGGSAPSVRILNKH